MTTEDAEHIERLAGAILQGAESAGIGVLVTVAGAELKHLFANRAAEQILGRGASELLRSDPLAVFTGGEKARLEELAAVFMQTGSFPPTIETVVTRADGAAVFVGIGLGGVTVEDRPGVVAFMADLTEQHLALASVRDSEERFRSVVDRLPEAIFITEGTEVTYANPVFADLLGRKPGGEGLLDILDLVHGEDVARLREQIDGLARGTATHAEYRMASLDGRALTWEICPIGGDFEGKATVAWLGRDVTARTLLEGEQLQADRLAVLGTLAAGMAHAINNPLSYTLLNLEHVTQRLQSLLSEPDYHTEARVRLAEAHDGAERVARVVRQMRALSRARPSAPGPVDVRAVLERVLAIVGHEIRYRGQLVTRYDPAPPVWASEGELEQAFLGLLLHVARSRPEGAGAACEVGVALGTDQAGGAVVSVSDHGPAPGRDGLSTAFDGLASAEPLGLGLLMCHSIFKSLGGHMDIESDPLTGMTFRVALPAAREEPTVESRRSMTIHPSIAPEPSSRRARVLVIDDDPGVGNSLRAMLEAEHDVRSVESGREGLKLLCGAEEFDVVFCDLQMPDVSGIGLYCALELNRPDACKRIVFMTGAAFTPDAERFLERVPNPRIEKPFSLARIAELLAGATRPPSVPPPPA